MANTTWIKSDLEPYVRGWLSKQFPGHTFLESLIILETGGQHHFDTVAEDGSIVAAILSNRPKTKTGNVNTGGVRKALQELEYLGRVGEADKIAVFTDSGFCELVRRRAETKMGKEMGNVRMLVCILPSTMQQQLEQVLDTASAEQRTRRG